MCELYQMQEKMSIIYQINHVNRPRSCKSARFEGKFFRFPAKLTVLEGYRQICGIIDYGGDALEFLIAKVKHIKNREYFSRFENTFRHSAAR